jgi:hypothetical protein
VNFLATLSHSDTLEVSLIDLETQVQSANLEYMSLKKLYTKSPTPILKTQLDQKYTEYTKIKYQFKEIQSDYRYAKKMEEKEERDSLENQRKITLFGMFEAICEQHYAYAIPELFNDKARWENIKWWENGKWASMKDESNLLLDEFYKRAKINQYILDKNDSFEFNHYIQSQRVQYLSNWNKYLLFKNGLMDEKQIVKNQPEYFTYKEFQYNLLDKKQLLERIDLPFLIYQFKLVTKDWDEICWWVGCAIRHLPMEYFLFFLGQPSGGKSPWAKAIKNLFSAVGTDGFDSLGDNGGLATSWDKEINIDFDANIAYLTSKTISKIKQIFGDDPAQNVKLLFHNAFQTKISPYMVVLINTMAKIPQGVNASALFKRAKVCEFNRQLPDNKDFKTMLEEQDFIDLFGSFCYWKSFDLKLENGDLCDRRANRLQAFINDTERQWMDSAYPVRNAINFLCKRSTNPDDIITARVLSAVVQLWFKDPKLNPLAVGLPSNLIGDITEAIKLLGGDKCIRNKKNAYEGVYWTEEGMKLYVKITNAQNKENNPNQPTMSDEEVMAMIEEAEKFEGFNDMEK